MLLSIFKYWSFLFLRITLFFSSNIYSSTTPAFATDAIFGCQLNSIVWNLIEHIFTQNRIGWLRTCHACLFCSYGKYGNSYWMNNSKSRFKRLDHIYFYFSTLYCAPRSQFARSTPETVGTGNGLSILSHH